MADENLNSTSTPEEVPPPLAPEETSETAAEDSSSAAKIEREAENRGGVFQPKAHHDVEEVKAKLFAAPDLDSVKQEVTSLWGWMSSTSASLKEQAEKLTEQAGPLAEKLSKNVMEFSENVKTAAEAKTKEFLDSTAGIAGGDGGDGTAMLPWEEPASQKYASAIRDRILELSEDDKTFLIPPPEAVKFQFDYTKQANQALAVMTADANLEKKRFALVPKEIDEMSFWRNYFYRVSLIKEAYQVSHIEEESHSALGKRTSDIPGQGDGSVERAEVHKMDGWDHHDSLDDHHEDVEGQVHVEEEENFDMLDDDELLASTGLSLDDGDEDVDDDDDDDDNLEERIKAELNLG